MTEAKSLACLTGVLAAALILTGCQPGQPDWQDDAAELMVDARRVLQQAAVASADQPQDALTRANALEAIADVLPNEQAGPLLMRGVTDRMPVVRFAAAMGLGDIRYAPAQRTLYTMAEDKQVEPDKRVLAGAIYALYRLGVEDHAPMLAQLLMDPEPEVVAHAAMVMGRMGEPAAVRPLRTVYAMQRDRGVRLAITEALASLDDPEFTATLEADAKTPYMDDRIQAIRTLGRLGTPRSREVLTDLMDSDRQPAWVRVAAAGALAQAGAPTRRGYDLARRGVVEPQRVLRADLGRDAEEAEIWSLQQISAIALGYTQRGEALGVLRPLLASQAGRVRVSAAMSVLRLAPAAGVTLAEEPGMIPTERTFGGETDVQDTQSPPVAPARPQTAGPRE